RRTSARGRAIVRRRFPGAPLCRRRGVPVASRAPSSSGRGRPGGRRGPAAICALRSLWCFVTRSTADRHWLTAAIELSRRCVPVGTAFSVGAIIVDKDGSVLAEGYSREHDPHEHAEEAALAELDTDRNLGQATLFSSMEPCSVRASRASSCTDLILAAG